MRWIVEEADDLVASGVLSPESAAALRRHYEQKLAEEETCGRVVLLSVLGATLVGAGVLLLIAHNWDELGRNVRTGLSLLPLIIALGLSLWTVLRRMTSTAWREAAGIAHCAGVAASIALVSQTYHIAGDLSDFLFTWLLLILPIPYLLGAVMPALVYLAGIAVWAGSFFDLFDNRHGASGYWLFLAGILPFYGMAVWKDRLGKGTAWLSAFLGLSMIFGLLFSETWEAWIPAFSGLLGVLYLAGALGFPERRYNPLRVLGALGIAVLSVWLSFKAPWLSFSASPSGLPWTVCLLAAGFPCAAALLLVGCCIRKVDFNRFAAAFPIVASFGYLAAVNTADGKAGLLWPVCFSLYGFALALGTAFRGIRQRAIPTLNGGLLLLAALVISRFVDSEFGIVERGLAFILLGVLILAANLWMLKTKREGRA